MFRSQRAQETMESRELLPAAGVEIQPSKLALPNVSLTFKDLGFSVGLPDGTQKTILEPCSGHLKSGHLVAFMGPSGCGKSTLLDMLAMKKTAAYTGEVLVNGHARDAKLFRRIAAYVPQEDVMPPHWTVREAIKFNASLKQPPGHGSANGMIDVLLEAFGLDAVAHTYIGGPKVRGISGGQRRRVTLARGVAAQASLLFCDEPTSGLSATDAELCVKALRVIAKRLNVLVVVVIHQPRVEVAALFDTLLLLTSNPGRMAYFGPMDKVVPYLQSCGCELPQHVNPTDYFLDRLTPGTSADASAELVATFARVQRPGIDARVARAYQERGMTIEDMLQAVQAQAARARMDLHPLRSAMGGGAGPIVVRAAAMGRYTVPFRVQFAKLLRRKLAISLRNPAAIALPLILPVVQGVVVGSMFQGIGEKSLFEQFPFVFILLTLLCLAGMQLIPILIEERTVMKYETSEALYDEAAAALASFCVDVPLALIGSSFNVLLMFVLSGISADYMPTIFFWALLLFFVFDSLFGFIAAIAEDTQQAQALAVPFISVFMLFNGFIITKSAAPAFLRWIFWISPNAYAFQAIVARMAQDAGETGQLILKQFKHTPEQDVQGLVIMLSASMVLRVLQLLALKFCHNIQK